MALGRPKPHPPALRLLLGAAADRLIVYREGLLLPPRSASGRAERGVRGVAPSAIRLDAFRRVLDAELGGLVTRERARRGILCLSSDAGTPALQRALRFARMLGLSGWASGTGSFARLCEPSESDLGTLLAWLLAGETTRITLARGRDAMEIVAPTRHRLEVTERVVHDDYSAPGTEPRGRFRSYRPEDAERALWQWARGLTATFSLEVLLAPPAPRGVL
jgi:hypothetical protein